MKLNFIQNLSDQVVRENHTLKNQLQRIRQQLKDYEWEMLEVIATILPQPPLALAPAQTFAEFVRQVRQEISDHRGLKQHALRLRQQYEQLQRQQLVNINTISQLKITLTNQQKEQEQAINEISLREEKVLKQLEWQKEYASRITDQMSEIKIQKLKLEENKRRAIEDMRQTQNSLLVNFRQQNEEQHMRVQKQLRREIQMRDKTIKEMSSSLAALTDVKNVQNSQEVLTGIFKSFQKYETLSALNAELKQQNQQLREQIKSLFNRIISIETETQQIKATQHNTRSQLQRTFMQKQDLQKQLLQKMADIAKHQRDKQAMELYYDQKWNSQYKKVKSKLETTYNAKLDELEKQGKAQIQLLKANIKQLIKEKEQYAEQVYQMTKLHKNQLQQKLALQQGIKQLKEEIQDLNIINRENGLMSSQQIYTLKTIFSEEQNKLLQKIRQLMASISQLLQKIRLIQLQHSIDTDEIHRKYKKQLQEKDRVLVLQRQTLNKRYNQDMAQLQKQIHQQIIYSQSIHCRVQKQFNIKLEQQKCIRARELALKQQEIQALNNRWIDKYCELQNLLVLTRKKHEQQLVFTKNQLSGLLQSDYHLHQQIQTQKQQIKYLEIQNKTLQTQIQDKRTIISQRDGSIASLKKDLQLARLQVQTLMANRKQWKNELLQLQREFLKEFESLRKLTRKQIQHHKDKIRELQDLNHMKSLTRREIAKIQSINTERQSLRSEIQLKQTQNIILNQVKDYYQARLRDSESQLARSDFRTTHAIIARRPKKSRLCNNEVASQRVLDSREPMFQKRRYAITSTQKHYNLSLSKGRLEQSSRKAVQTASSLM